MKTRAWMLLPLLAAVMLLRTGAAAQTTVDQRLIVVQNDGFTGGAFTIAIQVKATNLAGHNTLGTATIDLRYDQAILAYIRNTFPDVSSGISMAHGYLTTSSQAGSTIRVGVIPAGVDGVAATGTDLTTSYVTWGLVNFSILNAASTVRISIDPSTNQIGLFAQEGNSDGAGGKGSSVILNQTLSTPIVINETILPVELVSFTASAARVGTLLVWKTATETNNAGFDIERADALLAPESRVWTKLGFVEGAGTSSAARSYTFTVRNDAASGRFIYRLKQIDRDGGAKYSEIVEAPVVLPKDFVLLQNYPNPFNPSTSIGFALPEDSHVSIIAYDIIGRQAAVIVNDDRPAGTYSVAFDAGALSSGVYLYRMTARSAGATFSAVKRFVVLH